MDVPMKTANFKPSDPISLLPFLQNFKTACNSNGIHEEAAIKLFQHFMKDPAKSALVHSVCDTKEDDPQQDGKLTTHCQVVHYLLTTYATDDLIAEAEADINNFKEPKGISAVRYSKGLWEVALRCGRVTSKRRVHRRISRIKSFSN